jgi:hypothetical protein
MNDWDGTAWEGTGKAATGTGVGFWNIGIPLLSAERTPQALMKRAQLAYHINPWIGLAEGVVTRKVVGLPWHLEDGNDEEYEDSAPPDVMQARQLLERPQLLLGEQRPGTATRRLMTALTSRHIGLCGMSYWYADGLDARLIPTAWLYINPARMWPAEDSNGNLTGWVLDAQDQSGRGGTPLAIEEVLPFYLDPPDWGHLGSGIYERAILKAQITNLADQHAAYVIGTGGRIAGIVSPKDGTIPDEKFKALVAEFRNVNEAPDAAKRTTILQGPVDFIPTAANPSELNLVELAKMNRDDILAIWGVPPTQAGIAPQHAGGLNSGSTKGYDEAIFMQGAVHDRVVAIRETLQYGWLDKYQPTVIELEFEEPEFDDESPAFALLAQARETPLTNAQRLEIIGRPPTGDPAIDNAILLPSTITLWATAPAMGQTNGVIESTAPVTPNIVMGPPVDMNAVKARSQLLGLRHSVDARVTPALRKSVASALAASRVEIVKRIRQNGPHLARKPSDSRIWWDEPKERDRLSAAIRPYLAGIVETVTNRATETMGTPKKADHFAERVDQFVQKRAGERIKEMLATTKEAIQSALSQGFEEGLSIAEIGDLIEGSTTFNELRAETIARTETMFAYNDAALNSYGEFGVDQVQAIDGDGDPECAARDGQVFDVEEAYSIEDHPNGTLDWVPYFGKAQAKADNAAMGELRSAMIRSLAEPPVVNVAAPVVHVEAPNVNTDSFAAALSDLKAVLTRPRTVVKSVVRDATGRITSVIEEESLV